MSVIVWLTQSASNLILQRRGTRDDFGALTAPRKVGQCTRGNQEYWRVSPAEDTSKAEDCIFFHRLEVRQVAVVHGWEQVVLRLQIEPSREQKRQRCCHRIAPVIERSGTCSK
jgi:hypothetical protein